MLVKTFHDVSFKNQKLFDDFKEEYYSISKRNVLRGLHFQTPPYDHEKLVYCPLGKIVDVVVDLRNGSPTYGKFEMFTLDDESKDSKLVEFKNFKSPFYLVNKNAY